MRELLLYIPFLALFLVFIFSARNVTESYFVQSSVQSLLTERQYFDGTEVKDFYDAFQIQDIWDWLNFVLLPAAWPVVSYSGKPLPTSQRTYIAGYNKLLGSLRLRQVRVSSSHCEVLPVYKMDYTADPVNTEGKCYAKFSAKTSAESFQPSPVTVTQATILASNVSDAFTYRSCSSGVRPYWGYSDVLYGCEGFYIDIPFTMSQADVRSLLSSLQSFNWIDLGTGAVFVEFFVYNANVNLFSLVKYVYELPSNGATLPQTVFRTFSLWVVRYAVDYFLVILQLLFVIFVFYYVVRAVFEIREQRGAFFLNFWNLIDIINLVLFLIVFLLRSIWFLQTEIHPFDITSTGYPLSLEFVADVWNLEQQINAFNAVLCFLRVFKFLQLNDRLNLLGRTISEATGDLIGFLFMFAIVFLGYSLLALMVYGTALESFRNYPSACSSLFLILLGELDYSSMRDVNRVLTPIFFFSFLIIVIFILMNMFLAIVNDSYASANEKSREKSFVDQIKSFFKRRREKKRLQQLMKKASFAKLDALGDTENGLRSPAADPSKKPTGSPHRRNLTDDVLYDRLISHIQKHPGEPVSIADLPRILGDDVTPFEVARLRRKLQKFDTNNNNMIEMSEVTAALDQHNQSISSNRAAMSPPPSATSPRAFTSEEALAMSDVRLHNINDRLNRIIAALNARD